MGSTGMQAVGGKLSVVPTTQSCSYILGSGGESMNS